MNGACLAVTSINAICIIDDVDVVRTHGGTQSGTNIFVSLTKAGIYEIRKGRNRENHTSLYM